MIVESHISNVVVFLDRAQIVRSANIQLPAGNHKLIYDFLPSSTDKRSLQVSGIGNATIGGVKYQTLHYADYPDTHIKKMHDDITVYQEKIKVIKDKIIRIQSYKNFVHQIAQKATAPSPEGNQEPILVPEKWQNMLDFYYQKNEEYDALIFEAEKEKQLHQKEVEKLQAELQHISSASTKTKNQAEVLIEMHEEGLLILNLSYIVYNVSWYPLYDLRVSTESKKMNITYYAVIHQNTTEDWVDAIIKISTARPNISGEQPTLSPWYVASFKNEPYRGAAPNAMQAKTMLEKEQDLDRISALEQKLATTPPAKPQTAQVQTYATSVFFEIQGTHTVKSDNIAHRLTILVEDFAAEFKYSSTPRLSPFAYLKVKVNNHTDFPLLKGETNIFLDGGFVANGKMNLVAPNEDFWTSLGIDEGMKVEHKLIRRYEKKEGGIFTRKTTVIMCEYQIKIKNNKRYTHDFTLFDHLPISQKEDIKIQLIEPLWKENTDALKKVEFEVLEWNFKIEAGAEIQIPIKFSVEYPQGESLTGI